MIDKKINILVGARFQAKLLANFLQKQKSDFVVYTSSPKKNWSEPSLDGEKDIRFIPLINKILSRPFKMKPSRAMREFDAKAFDKIASYMMRDADILHGWATFSLFSARKYKKLNKTFILERACPHAMFQEQLLIEEADTLKIVYEPTSKAFLDRAVEEYELADKIIVPSKYSYDTFISRGFTDKKIEIVRLDANFIPVGVSEKRDDNTFVVGSVGGNILRKGYLYLIKAWQKLKLKNAKLLIKTSLSEIQAVSVLWDLIKDDESIEIVGYMKNIESFYRRCDVFCLPSIDDGFGMVVLEALACGLPVVSTKNVGASEMIEEGKTGFVVENRDIDAIAEKILMLYDDKGLVESMSKNSVDFYEQYKDSSENYESQIAKLYENL